jgi:hypothetical protein
VSDSTRASGSFSQQPPELDPEFLAAHSPRGAGKFSTAKFQLAGARAAKLDHPQHHHIRTGLQQIGNAPRQVSRIRPDMNHQMAALLAELPLRGTQFRLKRAVLVNFDFASAGARGGAQVIECLFNIH